MTRSQSEMDDLKNLQREAAELREKRKRTRSSSKPGKDEPSDPEGDPAGAQEAESDPAAESPHSDEINAPAGLAFHFDSVVLELETLARKHPSLALISAFTTGFFVGKLFSRR